MKASDFINILNNYDFDTFFGVPDSLLKSFCSEIFDKKNTITANEGNAIAMGCGHYLSTGKIPVIYMQNSGLGNCINPILSLADIYEIPLLLIIGWRGEPNTKDEPQHYKQGLLTKKILNCINLKNEILSDNLDKAKTQIIKAKKYMKKTNKSFAFIVKKNTFDTENFNNKKIFSNFELTRQEAIKAILESAPENSFFVSTTGYISRELYKNSKNHSKNFLTIGSMGHNSSIALAIALNKKNKNIICIDGDGALLMHMGIISTIAEKSPCNFKHILLNNLVHDSVGAQPTSASVMNFSQIFKNAGYKKTYSVETLIELKKILPEFIKNKELSFLEIKIKPQDGKDLPRPKETPQENKKNFMEKLNEH